MRRTPLPEVAGVVLEALRNSPGLDTLGPEALQAMAEKAADEIMRRELGILRVIPLFTELAASELERITRVMQVVVLDAGDVLYSEGDTRDECFVLARGECSITDARETRSFQPGQCVGWEALAVEGRWGQTCVATRDSLALGLSRDDLRSLLADDPLTMGVTTAALRLAAQAHEGPQGAILDPGPAPSDGIDGPAVGEEEEHVEPEGAFVADDPVSARLDQVDLTALLQRVAAEGDVGE